MSGSDDDALRLRRLRWQCRRGMLELDLLLHRFLDRGWPRLGDRQQADLERLLGLEDQVLIDWLLGRSVPADERMRGLVTLIRTTMRD